MAAAILTETTSPKSMIVASINPFNLPTRKALTLTTDRSSLSSYLLLWIFSFLEYLSEWG